jgi:magnesium and cobalt transporter
MDLSPPPRAGDKASKPSWLARLTQYLHREPEDRAELRDFLRTAFERQLLDADALAMMEGVLQMGEVMVRDVMVPRAQMDALRVDMAPEEFMPLVLETGHSRFPVYEDEKDNILGILLAKDLLRFFAGGQTDLRALLRPAMFIPESKRLDVLLKELRAKRNHMAIVVDEYGGVSGLLTIEDVLEQIVGEIEDEHDEDEPDDDIQPDAKGRWRVKALTPIDDLNAALGTRFRHDGVDTVGGLVFSEFGRVPERGEAIDFGGFRFRAIRVDARRIHTLLIERLPEPDADSAA